MTPVLHPQTSSPTTTDHTFYVFVDPVFGDDAYAGGSTTHTLLNPVGGTVQVPHQALSNSPPHQPVGWFTADGEWPAPTGKLIMAATPFHTITGALGYINTQFMSVSPFQLPWNRPNTNDWITHIKIILMPGKYIAGPRRVDPITGQLCGGEVFPVVLPEHVSLIGTSALNTVLDGSGETGIILMEGRPGDRTHEDTVIRNIHFTRAGGTTSPVGQLNGPAILLTISHLPEHGGHCSPVIRECLFSSNDIGIAIDNDCATFYSDKWGFLFRHSPIIVNNTFVGNTIGILNTTLWSTGAQQTLVAGGRPRIWNNIVTGVYPFVGVHYDDLKCSSVQLPTFWPDYNAYDPQYLHGVPPPVLLPGNFAAWISGSSYEPAMRPVGPFLPPQDWYAPQVNTFTFQNGLLFITEVFDRALGVQFNPSPHDYRLAPWATFNSAGPPDQLNPMVNKGIALVNGWFRANGQAFDPTWHPVPVDAAPPVVGFPYKWDCEGYGNPRIYAHPDYQTGGIDIGFDEMNDLIMAGYHNQTTIFNAGANSIPNGLGGSLNHPDSGFVYFFHNRINAPLRRPHATVEAGNFQFWSWIQGTGNHLVVLPGDNLTAGDNPSTRYSKTSPPTPDYPPFPRNLFCDTSPSPLPDLHALWGRMFLAPDSYAANNWNHGFSTATNYPGPYAAHFFDNPFHYHDPGNGITVHDDSPNPPGTWIWTQNWGYLLNGIGLIQWLPWTPQTYTVGVWGFGEMPTPDYIPFTAGLGVRYNCQVDPQDSNGLRSNNIQSFRTVYGSPSQAGGSSSSTLRWAPAPTERTIFHLSEALRAAGLTYWDSLIPKK